MPGVITSYSIHYTKLYEVLDCKSEASAQILRNGEGYIKSLAKVASLTLGTDVERPGQAATLFAFFFTDPKKAQEAA